MPHTSAWLLGVLSEATSASTQQFQSLAPVPVVRTLRDQTEVSKNQATERIRHLLQHLDKTDCKADDWGSLLRSGFQAAVLRFPLGMALGLRLWSLLCLEAAGTSTW